MNRNLILARATTLLSAVALAHFERVLPIQASYSQGDVTRALWEAATCDQPAPKVRDVVFITPHINFVIDTSDPIFE